MIKIGDKEYPFRFALKAQREMSQCENLETKDDVYFIYLGLKYGAIDDGQKWELNEDQVLDMLENDMEAYGRLCEVLGKQMGDLKKKRGPVFRELLR